MKPRIPLRRGGTPPRQIRRPLPVATLPRVGATAVSTPARSTKEANAAYVPHRQPRRTRPRPKTVYAVRKIPPFWRPVDDNAPTTPEKLRLWLLVCSALRIPYRQSGGSLQVPMMFEDAARRHFIDVAAENRVPPPPPPPVRHNIPAALAVLSLLFFWFAITRQWWISWPALSVAEWSRIGALDVWQFVRGEWYRAFTALTLHSDGSHLFNNLLFGAPFFLLLCRRAGTGPAALLAVLSGGLGNAGNALYRLLSHSPTHLSLGFSTALFGIAGALSAIMAVAELRHAFATRRAASDARHRLGPGLRRAFVFLAVSVAVLALLGSDPSERTDYAAHIFGLLGGLTCGSAYGLVAPRVTPFAERLMGCSAFIIVLTTWMLAFFSRML